MTSDTHDLPPLVHKVTPEIPTLAADWTHAAETRLDPPTAEQVRTADSVFAARKESETAAGLIGLWSSALILHDLAVETFTTTEADDERERSDPEGSDPED